MNFKIKTYKEEYEKIVREKSKHVTKSKQYKLLIIAFIFAITGILIGYISNQLTNLSYVTNMLVVTILGSIILYRYSTEKRYCFEHRLDYSCHLAVLPTLLRDMVYILGAIVTILFLLFINTISPLTIAFYTFILVLLIGLNIYISKLQIIMNQTIKIGHLVLFICYYFAVFFLTIKVLAIKEAWLAYLVSGLLIFVLSYLRYLLQEKIETKKMRAITLLALLYFVIALFLGVAVFSTTISVGKIEDEKRIFTYDYVYYNLFEGTYFSLASNGNRIMIVTHDKELIIFDQNYNEINRFDVSETKATYFSIYEIANQFYMGTSRDTLLINFDEYYKIDEEEGITLITEEQWNLNSFTYDGYTVVQTSNKSYIVSKYGQLVDLNVFLTNRETFMIEDNHMLYSKDTPYGLDYDFISNYKVNYSDVFYDDGYVFESDYNVSNTEYNMTICTVSDYVENNPKECIKVKNDDELISPNELYNFQYKNGGFYITNRFTSDNDYIYTVNRIDENGTLLSSFTFYDTNFDLISNHVIKEVEDKVLIAKIDSSINMYSNPFEGNDKRVAVISLSILFVCGLPTGILYTDKIFKGRRRKVNV